MTEFRNQIVGLIRFSYPALGGFAHGLTDRPAAEAMLFDPARLDRRFHLFQSLCLPGLLAQSDPDFTCIFLVGENMPAAPLQKLKTCIQPLQNAIIHHEPPRHHYPAQKLAYATVPSTGYTHRTSFRLDDDDALDVGYIARLKSVTARLQSFCSDENPIAVTFNHGFYVTLADEGNDVFDTFERTPVSVGSALMTPAGHPDNIYCRNHRFLPQFFNTYSDAVTPSFIRSIHCDNDSGPMFMGRTQVLSEQETQDRINTNFATKMADLLAL